MAKAAESSGEPGTTSPRPLVSLGSATKGTEGEAERPYGSRVTGSWPEKAGTPFSR